MDTDLLHRAVLHLPVVTTLCAAYFCFELFSRYRAKGGGLHLLWWGIGMATYGVGTFTEAWTSIVGWDPTVFRFWYIAGAFLGGYPLAQGSIYLLMKKRFAPERVLQDLAGARPDWAAWVPWTNPLRLAYAAVGQAMDGPIGQGSELGIAGEPPPGQPAAGPGPLSVQLLYFAIGWLLLALAARRFRRNLG